MKISAGRKLILLILGCLEWKCIPHQKRSHLGPNKALVGCGEEFHSRSYSGSSGKTGEHRRVVTSAFGLVKPGTHSTVPKSVHFPSFLGLLENWDQHVTFAWKGESWCSMPSTPPPRCPVAHQDTGVLGKQKVSQPGSSFAGWVCKEHFRYSWSFMILLVVFVYCLLWSEDRPTRPVFFFVFFFSFSFIEVSWTYNTM